MLKHKRGLILAAIIVVLVLADVFSPFKVQRVSIRLAAEPLARLGPLTITNTLVSSWVAILLLGVLAIWGGRKLVDVPAPLSWQNILEAALEALYDFMQGMVGSKARAFFPVVATFFLFILTSDWIGLLPGFGSIGLWEQSEGQRLFTPFLRGATTDLNTTLALALCSVLSMQLYGAHFLGFFKYSSRFVAVGKLVTFFRRLFTGQKARPGLLFMGLLDIFIGLLEILDELTKILSFSFRLFGNMFGGEVLLLIMAFLVPYVASIPFLLMELFVGFIQAFIFAVLTTAFLGRATTAYDEQPAQESQEYTPPPVQRPSTPR